LAAKSGSIKSSRLHLLEHLDYLAGLTVWDKVVTSYISLRTGNWPPFELLFSCHHAVKAHILGHLLGIQKAFIAASCIPKFGCALFDQRKQ